MKINGYELHYTFESMEDNITPDSSTLKVPYKDRIIYDENTVDAPVTLSGMLLNDEVEDIIGMIKLSRMMHLDYQDYVGFFYVTRFTRTWVKYMENGYKVSGFDIEGYFMNQNYFNLSWFSNYQKNDWDFDEPVIIGITEDVAEKMPDESVYRRFGFDDEIIMFEEPDHNIRFRGMPTLFSDAMMFYDGEKRIYNMPGKFKYDTVSVQNPLLEFKIYKDDEEKILGISGFCDDYGFLTDNVNNITDDDISITPDPFETKFTINHTEFKTRYCSNFLEVGSSWSTINFLLKRFTIATHSHMDEGSLFSPEEDPNPILIDRDITPDYVPEKCNYQYDPGFIHWSPEENVSCVSVTNTKCIQPGTGFYPKTGRNYLAFTPTCPVYIDATKMHRVVPSNWSTVSNGYDYYGTKYYIQTSNVGARLQYQTLFPTGVEDYEVEYQIYGLIRNRSQYTSAGFDLKIDGEVISSASVPKTGSVGNCKHILLSPPTNTIIRSGEHEVEIETTSGYNIFHYLLFVPTVSVNDDTPYSSVRQVLNDVNVAFEI